jgi:hypothetical protein
MGVAPELPEEEKARIQAEEVFRLAVRRDLEAKEPLSSGRARLWRILNSSFVLWFLSSVVVAGIAAVLASYEAGRAERLSKAETIRKLDTEIAGRLFAVRAALCGDRVRISNGEAFAPSVIYNITVGYLDNTVTTQSGRPLDFSIYPEYKNRTFRSLVFELSASIGGSQDRILKELLIDYEKSADLSAIPQNERIDQEESRKSLESMLKKVNRYLAEDRWRRRSMAAAAGECGY